MNIFELVDKKNSKTKMVRFQSVKAERSRIHSLDRKTLGTPIKSISNHLSNHRDRSCTAANEENLHLK
jgi:hypothetical protein